jgi:hypothetical protein
VVTNERYSEKKIEVRSTRDERKEEEKKREEKPNGKKIEIVRGKDDTKQIIIKDNT